MPDKSLRTEELSRRKSWGQIRATEREIQATV